MAGAAERVDWLAGAFYSSSERQYGQSAYAQDFVAINGGAVSEFLRAVTGIPDLVWTGSRALAGHPDTEEIFYSDLNYDFEQLAAFGEVTLSVTDRLRLTGGLRWYDFDEHRTQVFDGLFADPLDSEGTVRATGRRAAGHRQLRRYAGNAAQRAGLEGLPPRRHQRPAERPDLLSRRSRDLRGSRHVGGRGAVELRGGRQVHLPRRPRHVQRVRVLHGHPQPPGDGHRRHLLPRASSSTFPRPGARGWSWSSPRNRPPSSTSRSRPALPTPRLQSTVTSTDETGAVGVVSGIEAGRRLPTTPRFQSAAAATWRWLVGGGWVGYVSGTFQHVGSRFTQVGDQAEGFGAVDLTALAPALRPGTFIGGPLTQSFFAFESGASGLQHPQPAGRNPRRPLGTSPSSSTTSRTSGRCWRSTRSGAPWPASAI